jgi:acetylornithine deacetylase/succinyl-diaminopimelate desuccinylase-like protein
MPASPRDTLRAMTPTTARMLAADRLRAFVQDAWDSRIVPTLEEYVRIPAKSPGFDRDWQAHGHLDRAVELAARWARERPVEGLQVEVVRLPGRTPVLLMEIPGSADETVLLYGHLDKQPDMVGWSEGLGPWTPVRRGDRLYGRGAADDGYAAFAALTAVESLEAQAVPHARCVIVVETCEESGSADLPAYMEALGARVGTPGLVVCLDASCGNYDQLWTATSLRGLIGGELSVEVLEEGIHSGASGIVPSSFRIVRQLISRLEDERATSTWRSRRSAPGRRTRRRRRWATWAPACRSFPACARRTTTPRSWSSPTRGDRRSRSPERTASRPSRTRGTSSGRGRR